ncbi:MAG: hypothetical protein JJU29_09955 [Verrucomicrobia bacterium]|nr:hypothetical protein [Verrucomicrobiota bacterium]MCH8512279.1 hypothetical protein [Kiritimatiellia bacterium]
MPVVGTDWLQPARWAPVQIGWGVARDGDQLRFCRRTARGKHAFWQVPLAEWNAEHEVSAKLRQDVKRGARLVAGLDPSKVLIRELSSPFKDRQKTEEIWPSVLDAAIPFPLENCQAAFLFSRVEGEGMRCLALAARDLDLQSELKAWKELDLEPEFLVPEVLLLPAHEGGVSAWFGNHRAIFATWGRYGPTASGSAKDANPEGRAFKRFLAAHADESGTPPAFSACGPRAHAENAKSSCHLETALADAGVVTGHPGVNLRAGDLAHPRLAKQKGRKSRGLMFAAVCVLLVSLSLRPAIGLWFESERNEIRQEIADIFEAFTGYPSPARGEEALLLDRYLEREWGQVSGALTGLRRREIPTQLADVLLAAQFTGTSVRELRLSTNQLHLEVQALDTEALRLGRRLKDSGWRGEPRERGDGVWVFEGELQP